MKMTINIRLDQNMFAKHKRYLDVIMLVKRNLTCENFFNLNILHRCFNAGLKIMKKVMFFLCIIFSSLILVIKHPIQTKPA